MWDEFARNLKEHGYGNILKDVRKAKKPYVSFITKTHHIIVEYIFSVGYYAHIREFETGKNEYFTNGQYDSCVFKEE